MEQEYRRFCVGLVAHVDAGKTTLAEAMLYRAGLLRSPGRVDHGDTAMDYNALERERGITIFASQAHFSYHDWELTLLDTPGHVDFSAETERMLRVLDCAILVVSGVDGVQAHAHLTAHLAAKQRGALDGAVAHVYGDNASHELAKLQICFQFTKAQRAVARKSGDYRPSRGSRESRSSRISRGIERKWGRASVHAPTGRLGVISRCYFTTFTVLVVPSL